SLGHREVWQFLDMAGGHPLSRMPAVDQLLPPLWDPVVASANAGKSDRSALEAAARHVDKAINDPGPRRPRSEDLARPRSPYHVEPREDARFLPVEAREALGKLSRELDALKAQASPLPSAHGIQEGGLRHGPSPGYQDARVHIRGSYSKLGAVVP